MISSTLNLDPNFSTNEASLVQKRLCKDTWSGHHLYLQKKDILLQTYSCVNLSK